MASYTVRCLPCVLHFRQSNNAFYRIPVFFKQNFFLSPRWKIKWPCFLFFCIYFSAKIFEFIFDPRCKIECALGHLDRVFLWWFFFILRIYMKKKLLSCCLCRTQDSFCSYFLFHFCRFVEEVETQLMAVIKVFQLLTCWPIFKVQRFVIQ